MNTMIILTKSTPSHDAVTFSQMRQVVGIYRESSEGEDSDTRFIVVEGTKANVVLVTDGDSIQEADVASWKNDTFIKVHWSEKLAITLSNYEEE